MIKKARTTRLTLFLELKERLPDKDFRDMKKEEHQRDR
jgi:hypothetical protein